ncbi:MAG: autotransporter outer membrane beta-barrel domain-containing protein [Acetobacterales bacterium]
MPAQRPRQTLLPRRLLAAAFVAGLALAAAPVQAQDAGFQNYFSGVCQGTPTGQLATLCGQTPGGNGGLSSDSQSSLSPSQVLSGGDTALSRSRGLQEDARERMEDQREAIEEVIGPRFSVFTNLRGEFYERDRGPGDRERGYEGSTVGVQIGGDYRIDNSTLAGIILTYDRSDTDFDADQPGDGFVPFPNDGGNEEDNYALNLYASRTIGDNAYIDGTVGYGYSEYEFARRVVFQESTRTVATTPVVAEADTEGYQLSAGIGAGYDFYRGALQYGPYVRATWVRSEIDGYTETDVNNSGLAVSVDDSTATSLTSVLGVRASYSYSTSWGVLVPQGRVEWEHEFRDDARDVTTRLVQDATNTALTVRTDEPDRDYFNVGAGLLLVLPNGIMPFIDVETLVGYEDFDRTRVTGGVRLEF